MEAHGGRIRAELAANAGRALAYEHPGKWVWRRKGGYDVRPMRTVVSRPRGKPGDDVDNPACVFTETRAGY